MKSGPKMPTDLDHRARKKWSELVGSLDVDADGELLANYCRQHSNLVAIRCEKAKQEKAGTFSVTVPGRDGTMILNPLLTAQGRLNAALNKMLVSLGLATSREQRSERATIAPTPRPAGMHGDEPKWGWDLEEKICGPFPETSAAEIESNRRRPLESVHGPRSQADLDEYRFRRDP